MVRIKSESELRHFMNEVNQKHQSIKFDFKFSKESVEFLDTLVYIDSKKRLQTTLYKKPTDCQTYLHARPAHPFSLKKVFHIVTCICSTFDEYRKHSQDLIKSFVEKGYNESTVRKKIERVDHLDRSLILKNCKSKGKDSIPLSVTYNSVLPNIKEIINKLWHILNIDSTFKEIFNSSQLMITFRKKLIGTTKNFLHLQKQQPQVNVPHVTLVNRFVPNMFTKQQHLQALKPERPLQFFPKSLAIVTMSSTY